jgi:hypothetical protein
MLICSKVIPEQRLLAGQGGGVVHRDVGANHLTANPVWGYRKHPSIGHPGRVGAPKTPFTGGSYSYEWTKLL